MAEKYAKYSKMTFVESDLTRTGNHRNGLCLSKGNRLLSQYLSPNHDFRVPSAFFLHPRRTSSSSLSSSPPLAPANPFQAISSSQSVTCLRSKSSPFPSPMGSDLALHSAKETLKAPKWENSKSRSSSPKKIESESASPSVDSNLPERVFLNVLISVSAWSEMIDSVG